MLSSRPAGVTRSLAIRLTPAVAGSALLAVSAHVAVPMLPVPITLQTLAIPLLVLALGRNLAVMTTLLYLAEGAVGLPVFAPIAGPPGLVGPTAGYLWMYPVAAFAMGALLDCGLVGSYAGRWAAIFAGTCLTVGAVGSGLPLPVEASENAVVVLATISTASGPSSSRLGMCLVFIRLLQ